MSDDDSASYDIALSERAAKALRRIHKSEAKRIRDKLRWLAAHVEDVPHIALAGNWQGYYRLRVGNYRVIYEIDRDGRIIIVELIGHRRDVY